MIAYFCIKKPTKIANKKNGEQQRQDTAVCWQSRLTLRCFAASFQPGLSLQLRMVLSLVLVNFAWSH